MLDKSRREAAALPNPPRIYRYHYRSTGGVEVDLAIEGRRHFQRFLQLCERRDPSLRPQHFDLVKALGSVHRRPHLRQNAVDMLASFSFR